MSPDIIAVVLFCVITVFVFMIVLTLSRLIRDPIREQLEAIARNQAGDTDADQIPESQLFVVEGDDLRRDLRRAGFYKPSAVEEFRNTRLLLLFLGVVLTGISVVVIGPEQTDLAMRVLGIGLVASVLLWAVPRLYLRHRGNRRVQRIANSLPDALDMMTMCMSGGMAFLDSMAHVSRELVSVNSDLAVELALVRKQAELSSLDIALTQFADRIDAPEVRSMTALISHGQRLGTSVVDAIHDYADSLRLKWRQTADERANKAAVKLLFPVVMFLLPGFFILLVGPSLLEFWDFIGNMGAQIESASSAGN